MTDKSKIVNRAYANTLGFTQQSKQIQAKLTINQPNDAYEQEADAMADKVMRMSSADIQTKPLSISSLQRKCAHCEEEDKKLQMKETMDGERTADNELENYVGSLSGGGQPLSKDVRSFYEPRFGYDFSNVRIHINTLAAKSADSINALAYTNGNHIVFNEGQYSPDSVSGKRLLGHELTHVVQQQGNIQRTLLQRSEENDESFENDNKLDGGSLPGGVQIDGEDFATNTQLPLADMSNIIIKRKNISLKGEDKYGHWWAEINGSKSYGWWPKYHVGFKETLFGTEGELNGQTSFGGSPTRDPHHGDTAEEQFNVICTDPTKTEPVVVSEMESFANSYHGEWRWTFGWGQNCHTFQEAMLANSSLITK